MDKFKYLPRLFAVIIVNYITLCVIYDIILLKVNNLNNLFQLYFIILNIIYTITILIVYIKYIDILVSSKWYIYIYLILHTIIVIAKIYQLFFIYSKVTLITYITFSSCLMVIVLDIGVILFTQCVVVPKHKTYNSIC